MTTITAKPDAVALLKADHRKVEGLFAKFQGETSREKKKLLAGQICMELSIHTKIEEDIFYPACAAALKPGKMSEALVEHDAAKVLVAEIETGAPDDKFYDSKVKVLSDMIEHHVEEEERRVEGMFSQARRAGLDMDMLGAKMAAKKETLLAAYKVSGPPKLDTPSFSGTKLA